MLVFIQFCNFNVIVDLDMIYKRGMEWGSEGKILILNTTLKMDVHTRRTIQRVKTGLAFKGGM